MRIAFKNRQRKYKVDDFYKGINTILCRAWESLKKDLPDEISMLSPEISLSFCSENAVKKLNSASRGIDAVTDVLSFPAHEFHEGKISVKELEPGSVYPYQLSDQSAFEFTDPHGVESGCFGTDQALLKEPPECIHLGDIVICVKRASEQAESLGHSLERELDFLSLHAFLHLCGFDHQTTEQEEKMTERQRAYLRPDDFDLGTPEMNTQSFKSGFVCIAGLPNAGKSSLINFLNGEKIAITSHKVQTTRKNMRLVVNSDDAQIIFLDTPGIHEAKNKLGLSMMNALKEACEHSDLMLLLADCRREGLSEAEKEICAFAAENGKKTVLALNKIDTTKKLLLLPKIKAFADSFSFTEIVPISAHTGENVDELMNVLKKLLPNGEAFFDDSDYTDQSERILTAELIREQILELTSDEIPHSSAVLIQLFDEREGSTGEREFVRIKADIICEQESQKIILLGKHGSMIKKIGEQSRIKIEEMLGCAVYLELFVKVRKKWRNNRGILQELDYKS